MEQTIQAEPQDIKRKRTRDIAVLGILLLIYQFSAKLFVYTYYYIAYFIFSGKFSLSWSDVLNYFKDNKDLANSTSFEMAANISVTAATVLLTLVIARFVFRIRTKRVLRRVLNGCRHALCST